MNQDHFGAFVPLAWGLMWFAFWAVLVAQGQRERARLYSKTDYGRYIERLIP